jgi:peptidoglycan-associated lipoprotein
MMGTNRSALVSIFAAIALLGISCAKKPPADSTSSTAPDFNPPSAIEESEEVEPSWQQQEEVPEETLTQTAPSIAELNDTGALRTIFFDFDKYNLKPDATAALNQNLAWLRANPDFEVRIEGHCDERGTDEYNLALGDRRSTSAKSFLVERGIPASRLRTISYGEERPIDPRHNEQAWGKNRRADFVIVRRLSN